VSILWGTSRRNSDGKEFSLADIRIASPCPADWEKMIGDERVRHCSECNLNVYDLSAMKEHEIRQLIAANQGRRLCSRFYRRADGMILTQDCPWSLRMMARKACRIASAVLTALMSVTVAAAKTKSPKPTCECHQIQQKDSGIKLTVTDPDGAVIPNAEIALESKSGKETLAGSTGPSGEWSAIKLVPGEYRLTVKSRGFRAFIGDVSVYDSRLLGLKIKLPIGELKETVEVRAEAAVIMGTTVGILESKHSSTIPISISGGARMPMQQ
jgi:Carboxypeptidase regulatory-like domain